MATLLDTLDPLFADCLLRPWHPRPFHQLDRPWVANGWVHATDRRIIVRQRTRRKDTGGRFPSRCNIKCVFGWTPKEGSIITLPRIGRKRPDLVRCPDCRGSGCTRVSCIAGKVAREAKSIAVGCGEYGLADRYIWLLRDHGITIVQPTTHATCYAFGKDRIEGRLMGTVLGADDDG